MRVLNQRFLAGRLVATLADQLLMFAIPLVVYKTTGSVAKSGLAFAIEWLPRVLSLPLAGSLADRLGGLRVFMASDFVRGAASLGAYVALRQEVLDPFLTLSLLAATLAFFAAQSQVSLETLVPRLTRASEIPKAQSTLQAMDQISSIFGPLLGSALLLVAPSISLIGLAALAYLASALNLVPWKNLKGAAGEGTGDESRLAERRSFVAGFRQIADSRVLLALTGYSMVANLVIGVAFVVMASLAMDAFGVSDSMYGWVGGVSGMISVAVLFAVPRLAERFPLGHISGVGYCACLLGALTAALAPSFPVYVAGHGLMLGGVFCFNVYMRTQRARLVEPRLLGRTVGAQMFLNQLILPVSGLLVAYFSSAYSSQTILKAVTLVAMALALAVYSIVPRLRPVLGQ